MSEQIPYTSYNPYINSSNQRYPSVDSTVYVTDPTANAMAQQEEQNQRIAAYREQINARLEANRQLAEQTNMSLEQYTTNAQEIRSNPYDYTTQERTQLRAIEASQKAKARLGDEQAERAQREDAYKSLNRDRLEVQKERQALNDLRFNPKARIENLEQLELNPELALPDTEFYEDVYNMPDYEVYQKYADQPEIINYIQGKRQQRTQDTLQATQFTPDEASILGIKAGLAALAGGLAENVSGYQDIYNMAAKRGQERIDALNINLNAKAQKWSDNILNAPEKASNARFEAMQRQDNRKATQEYLNEIASGSSKEEATQSAEWEKAKDTAENLYVNPYQITKEIAQSATDIGVSLVSGGLIAKGAKTLGKTALETAVKEFDKSIRPKIAREALKQAELQGISKTGREKFVKDFIAKGKDDYIKQVTKQVQNQVSKNTKLGIAGFEAVNTASQNAPQGYQTASQNIMNTPIEKLKETQGWKDLKAEYPNLSDKELQIKMADEAGVKGYGLSTLNSAVVGAIGSKFESGLITGNTKTFKNLAKGTAIQAGQEGAEEGGSVYAGNKATNIQAKDKIIDEMKGIAEPTVIGAIAGAGSSAGIGAPVTIKNAVGSVVEKGVSKVVDKQETKLNKQSNEAVNDVLGSDEVSKDKDKEEVTTNTTGVFGKKFSETNFGKAYNKFVDDLSNNEVFKDLVKNKKDYTGNISNLRKLQAKLESDIKKAEELGKTEGIAEKKQVVAGIQQSITQLSQALSQDMLQSSDESIKLFEKIIQKETSGNLEEAEKLWNKHDELMAKDERIQKLKESSLYSLLDPENKGTAFNSTQGKFTSQDILGDGDFSFNPNETFKKVSQENTEVVKNLKDITPEETAKVSQTIAENLAKFSASIASLTKGNQLNEVSVTDIRKKYSELLKPVAELAKRTKNKNLQTIVDEYNKFLSKPIPTKLAAKAYVETMFGGANLGMMDYLTKALANGGTLDSKSRDLLLKFGFSQKGKLQGLQEAREQLSTNLTRGDNTPVKLVNRALRNANKHTQNLFGEEVSFTSHGEINEYENKIKGESKVFNALGRALLGLDLKQTVNQTQAVKEQQVNKPSIQQKTQSLIEDKEDIKTDNNTEVKTDKDNQVKSSDTTTQELNQVTDVENKEEYSYEVPEYNLLVQTVDSSMNFNERIVISSPYIGDKVAMLWEGMKDTWGKTNNISKDLKNADKPETDTVYEIHTTKGVQEIRIPMSAMVEMQRKGYNPTINLLDTVTKLKQEDNATVTQEEIDNFVSKPTSNGLGSNVISESLAPIMKSVNDYFNNKNLAIFSGLKMKLNKFHLVNGFLNLFNITEDTNGNPIITLPNEVKFAFAKTQALVLADYRDLAYGIDKQYEDYWYEDEKATSYKIVKNTTKELLGKGFSSPKVEKEATEALDYAPHDVGIIKDDLITKLGRTVVDQLGLQFDKSAPHYNQDTMSGLVYSFGIEAYNMLLNQGLIDTYSVELYQGDDNNAKLIKEIPYVNFKLNTDIDSKIAKAIEVLDSGLSLNEMSLEQAQAIIDKNPRYKIIFSLQNKNNNEIVQHIFGSNEFIKPEVIISNLDDRKGKEYKAEEIIAKAKTKNDITNTYNQELDSAVAHMESTTFKLNLSLYNLLKDNPEAMEDALGYTRNVENLNVTEETKKAIRSKNNAISRSIGLIHKYVNKGLEQGIPLEKIAFNFPHHFVSNMRVMAESDLNPQGNKIVRELLQLVDSKVDSTTGKIEGELDLNIDLNKQFKTKGEPRTVADLIKKAKGIRKTDTRNFAIGFLMALNQGLDIGKIEKTRDNKIFTQVAEELEKPESLFQKITDLVWVMQQAQEQGKEYVMSKEEQALMREFGKEMGNGSPRALSAIQSWANFKYRGTNRDVLKGNKGRSQFSTPLFLEADGIGNGLHNITRQFVTKFTPSYFNTLKRTGMVTMDILAQFSLANPKLAKANKREEFIRELAGSAGLFTDKNGEKRLEDIYEIIASKLAVKANNSLKTIIDYFSNSGGKFDIKTLNLKHLTDMKDKTFPKDVQDSLRFLIQLGTTGHSKLSKQVGSTPLNQLIFKEFDNIYVDPNTLVTLANELEVARNLAKSGVTPTVYGGQLEGIATQLYKDIKGKLISNLDKLIETRLTNNSEDYNQTIQDLRMSFASLGLQFTSFKDYKDKIAKNQSATVQDYANFLVSNVNNNKATIINNLKKGLASGLREAVQESYVDEFAMLNFSMAQDDISFVNFTTELMDKMNQAIQDRNTKKKYALNDPRRFAPLARKEIRGVIATITSAPIIATAFANDAVLFEDVLELGNSLVKQGKYTIDDRSTITSQYANTQGKWVYNITTQMFSSYQKYNAAGASQATSTIPSTESKTQSILAEKLMKVLSGITSLNVFDGVDGKVYFRDLLGKLVNESTNEVHLKSSMLEHFYHKFTRSGINDVLLNRVGLSDGYKQSLKSNSTITQFIITNINNNLTVNDAKHLLSLITLMQMDNEYQKLSYNGDDFGGRFNKLSSLFNNLKGDIREKTIEATYNNTNEITLKPLTGTQIKTLESAEVNAPVFTDNTQVKDINSFLFGYYNRVLKQFSNSVAENRATKYIEENYLPVVINQFAGANRGFLFNPERLDDVGKRFVKFVESKLGKGSITNVDLVNDSRLLVEFLNTDEEIKNAYESKKRDVFKKLHKPVIATKNFDNNLTNITSTTLNNFMKDIKLSDNVPLHKVIKVVMSGLNKDLPVLLNSTKEELDKLLPKDFTYPNETREQTIKEIQRNLNKNTAGSYVNKILINEKGETKIFEYIRFNPQNLIDNQERSLVVIAHELIHAFGNTMYAYMIDSVYREQLREANTELADKLDTFTQRLEGNIQAFVKKNQQLSAIQDRLYDLRNNPKMRHHYVTLGSSYVNKQAFKIANIANYIYFFNELSKNNLPEGMTVEQLKAARAGTLHELMSFSLSEQETINELAVHKEIFWFKNLSNSLKEFYRTTKESLLGLFGLKPKENTKSEDYVHTSMFEAMLESMYSFNQVLDENTKNDLDFNMHNLRDNINYGTQEQQAYLDWAFNGNGVNTLNNTTAENVDEDLPPWDIESPMINSQMSETNRAFRNKVKDTVKVLRELDSTGNLKYPAEALTIVDTNINKQVSDLIAEARSNGFSVTLDEENDIQLAYKLNLINQDLNHSSNKQISKVMTEQVDNLPSKVVNLINKFSLDKSSILLPLLTLSKSGNNLITKPVKNNQSKLQAKLKNIQEFTEDLFDLTGLTKEEQHLPTIDKLQLALASFNTKDNKSMQERDFIVQNELNKAKAVAEIANTVSELTDKLPEPLSKVLSGSADLFTGKDFLPSGSDQDSSLGQLVRLWVRNHEQIYGRNTLLSKFVSWIIGQDSATQYAAKLKGEASQLNAIIRERLSKTIPESIRTQFENLSETHEEALNNVLVQSQLNRLNYLSKPISELLTDVKSRELMIAELEGEISSQLEDLGFKGKAKDQALNFIRWQTQGLGEWVITNEAKEVKGNNNILPNAKVISSLQHIKRLAGKDFNAENNVKALRSAVESLVSLHSLDYHNQEDLNTIAELAKEEPKAFKGMTDTMNTLDDEMEVYGHNSYMGYDGFTMNKRNPYKDIKLLNIRENPKTYGEQTNRLEELGYTIKATLADGTEVWYTDENPSNRFTTGVFNLSEHSIRGADINRMTPLHSYDTEGKLIKGKVSFEHHPALNDPNYYNKLTSKSSVRTIIDNTGNIVGYSTALPKSIEKDLIETFENGIDAIGNAKGRITEEIVTEVNNKTYVDELIKVYKDKASKGQANRFILIDGKFEPKSDKQADLEFAQRVNNIYNSLPTSTKKHIQMNGGLYIERTELDNLLGYNQASILDIYTGKSGLPKPVQNTIKATFDVMAKVFRMNPVKFSKRLERGLSEVASLSKDFVLVRSGVVAAGNMMSNVVHLWNTGVPLKSIPEYIREGFMEVRRYNKEYNRTLELRHLISITSEPKQKAKYQLEMDMLEKSLSRNPVLPLVNEGILTNISSASGVEESNQFGLINSAQRKIKIDKFKQTQVGKTWANVMIQESSATHSFMNGALDYGDFVAKYALYKHLTKNRQFNSDRALNVIRDEFINYGLNRGRAFDWMNKVGLTWFLSYKLGIQKIFLRNLRRNFLRSAAVYSGAKVIGTNNVVPAQNLLYDGSLHYQTNATNLWEGFKTHWIGQVFG